MSKLSLQQMENACSYASLILADEDMKIEESTIVKLLDAAGIVVEPYLPMLFARALKNVNVADIISSSVGSGAAPAANSSGAPAASGEAAAAEEAEPEPEEESDDDMGFSLFD